MCHYTRIPIPWYPYPYTHGTPYLLPTYIHALIHLFILLSLCQSLSLFVLLSLSLLLFSSLLFCLFSLSPCLLSKACPWAGAAGLIYLVCANTLFYLIIIQQCTCMVQYVCISMCCIAYVYTSFITHVSNRCMYVHSMVCIVLFSCGLVYVQQYTCCAVQCGLPVHGIPLVYSLCV